MLELKAFVSLYSARHRWYNDTIDYWTV